MEKRNEIDVVVGSEAENKSMYENTSTESANKGDSGIQTESLLTSESNTDESKVMNEVAIHSTPIVVNQNKKSDEDNMLTRLYNMMYSNFSELRGDINIKFNEQKNSFDSKFDEQKNEIQEIKSSVCLLYTSRCV